MRKYLLAAIAALASTSVFATELKLSKTLDATPSEEASKVDIMGITPGMDAKDAWKIFAKAYPSAKPETQKTSIRVKAHPLESQEFEVAYDSGIQDDGTGLKVFLASPSTGGGVFAVQRDIDYSKGELLPRISDVVEQLEKKYGKPIYTQKFYEDGSFSMFWYVGGESTCKNGVGICNNVFRATPYSAFDPAEFKIYIKEMDYGPEVVLGAKVTKAAEEGRAISMGVSFIDLKRRGLSALGALHQVWKAQDMALGVKPKVPSF